MNFGDAVWTGGENSPFLDRTFLHPTGLPESHAPFVDGLPEVVVVRGLEPV